MLIINLARLSLRDSGALNAEAAGSPRVRVLTRRVYLIELSNNFLQIGTMFDPHGVNEPDHLRIVNQVVRGNLDVAMKLLAVKPDKDLEIRAKKMQVDCDKTLKKLGS